MSGGGLADRLHEVVGLGVFEQVADGAGVQRRPDAGLLGEGGEHDDASVGASGQDLAGGLDTVHAGHRQVHQHDVGPSGGRRVRRPRTRPPRRRRLQYRGRRRASRSGLGGPAGGRRRPARGSPRHLGRSAPRVAPVSRAKRRSAPGGEASRLVPRPAADSTRRFPPRCCTSAASRFSPTLPCRRADLDGSKPCPSSLTCSWSQPSSSVTISCTVRGVGVPDDVTDRFLRHAVDQRFSGLGHRVAHLHVEFDFDPARLQCRDQVGQGGLQALAVQGGRGHGDDEAAQLAHPLPQAACGVGEGVRDRGLPGGPGAVGGVAQGVTRTREALGPRRRAGRRRSGCVPGPRPPSAVTSSCSRSSCTT